MTRRNEEKSVSPRMQRVAVATLFTGLFGVGFATALGFSPALSQATILRAQDSSALDRVDGECWELLRGKRIYFAHQSVGSNILKGVSVLLKEHPDVGLRVRSLGKSSKEDSNAREGSGEPFAEAGLVQGPAGANGDASAKLRTFVEFLRSPSAANVDIALLKFCYADVNASTDVDALFREYKTAMELLKRERPTVRIVHCTVPLKCAETSAKARVKKVIGRGTESANVARGQFNNALRKAYDANTIFDVARAEATRADGGDATVTVQGVKWPALAAEYSDDGGHLNAVGQLAVAREFLLALSRQCKAADPVKAAEPVKARASQPVTAPREGASRSSGETR